MSRIAALRDRIHKWRRSAKRRVLMAWGDFSGHVRHVMFEHYKCVCVCVFVHTHTHTYTYIHIWYIQYLNNTHYREFLIYIIYIYIYNRNSYIYIYITEIHTTEIHIYIYNRNSYIYIYITEILYSFSLQGIFPLQGISVIYCMIYTLFFFIIVCTIFKIPCRGFLLYILWYIQYLTNTHCREFL
jgi:hypothetical protein